MLIEILTISLSGYIFIVPEIVLYFWYLNKKGKKQKIFHAATTFVFCYYLIGILTMTGITSFEAFSPRIVLVPFVDMIRGPIDTILNVILFLPLGFFLALLYKNYNRISIIALTGFLLSLSVELIQMFGMGITDINDLITNTIGTCLGYSIYKLLSKTAPKELCEKFQADKINDNKEVLFFAVCSFIIMLTIRKMI